MKIYEVIDHPADLKLRIFGKDLPELFCNLMRVIAEEQTDRHSASVKKKISNIYESIEIESPDLFSLFVDFANEIIYRSDANNKIYNDCIAEKITCCTKSRSRRSVASSGERVCRLKAKISGIAGERRLDIKAATYHEGYVKKVNEEWEGVILFDI